MSEPMPADAFKTAQAIVLDTLTRWRDEHGGDALVTLDVLAALLVGVADKTAAIVRVQERDVCRALIREHLVEVCATRGARSASAATCRRILASISPRTTP